MILRHHVCRCAPGGRPSRLSPLASQRWLSSTRLEGLQAPVQVYQSTSRDPYLNLSIEHHLLQKSSAHSVILFLYVNRPSIIIGRNQNPWLEVNLPLLNACRHQPETEPPGLGVIDLVRRRSGGGTVFHDEGNVNWSVICPSSMFTRDKHAEMVVRALRSAGIERARVNARHDIVLDQGARAYAADPKDTHSTPYEAIDFDTPPPLKVSGSAYKLTRNRALHHGTCLLSSPNLNTIPDYLHSAAKPFITARGVESVSSPVGNILLANNDFMEAVQTQFATQYGGAQRQATIEVGEEWLDVADVQKGYSELKSHEWLYLQTPQFTLSTKSQVVMDTDLELSVRYGVIDRGTLSISSDGGASCTDVELGESSLGQRLHEVESWSVALKSELDRLDSWRKTRLVAWLEAMLPVAR